MAIASLARASHFSSRRNCSSVSVAKKLRAVAGGMAERFEQTRCNQPWNLVRFKAEIPCRLSCIKPGGNELPTEKFGLLGSDVHT
jgi:hypothetical protein